MKVESGGQGWVAEQRPQSTTRGAGDGGGALMSRRAPRTL